ncbi:MAG: type VI secretion system tube protein Hcp [Ferruginibacter sp.]|nr:type VI secretion system tube protein Hcp [Ferruginibacter sp.]
MKQIFTLFIVAVFTMNAFAQQKIFIQIQNIPGESTDANHHGWIDAYAYSGGMTTNVSRQSGGTSVSKAYFSDYVFTICLDRSVNPMKIAQASAKLIPTVIIELSKLVGGNPKVYSKIELTDVLITGLNEGATSDINKTTFNVSYSYAKIKTSYFLIDPATGLPTAQASFSWDVVNNKAY